MISRFACAAAVAACAAMATAPLAAAELPQIPAPIAVDAIGVFEADAVNAAQYRYFRPYRRNRTSAGDVIGAVVAIGAIAAVVSAVGKASTQTRDDRYPQRYPYPDRPYDYRSSSPDVRYDGTRGLDRAVDMCAREIERNARIDQVESANRTDDGWTVIGRLRTGDGFTCTIGPDGRIGRVDYGNRGALNDWQWGEDRYAAARAAHDAAPAATVEPYPSETEADDDRYETAQAPEFNG